MAKNHYTSFPVASPQQFCNKSVTRWQLPPYGEVTGKQNVCNGFWAQRGRFINTVMLLTTAVSVQSSIHHHHHHQNTSNNNRPSLHYIAASLPATLYTRAVVSPGFGARRGTKRKLFKGDIQKYYEIRTKTVTKVIGLYTFTGQETTSQLNSHLLKDGYGVEC